ILNAARYYGLRGRGVAADLEDLDCLPQGAILHWQMRHFVVLDRVHRNAVDIVDPRAGPRRVPMAEFGKCFTGVVLLLEPGEEFRPSSASERPAWLLMKRILWSYPGLWARVLTTSLVLQLLALAVPILTSAVVDQVVPAGDTQLLWVLVAAMAMMVAFTLLSALVRGHLLLRLRTHFDARMTTAFVEHIVGLPYAFFQNRSIGDLLDRIFSNREVRDLVTTGALSAVLDGTLMSLYLVLIVLISPTLAGVVLVLAVLHLAVFWLTRTRHREHVVEEIFHQGRASGYTVEMLAGIETIKLSGAEPLALEYWSNLFVKTLNATLRKGALDAAVEAVLTALRLASPLVVLAVGTSLVLSGDLRLGAMLGLSALAIGFLGPLAQLVETAIRFQALMGYLARLDDVFEMELEQAERRPVRGQTLRGAITLDEVSMRYGPLAPLALRDVSVHVESGTFVAIVGRSGAGKTTLAGLLTGLYQPCSGRVLFDGSDLRELDITSVRQQIGVVPQNPYVFSKSVRHNIALADVRVGQEAIERAATLAQAHDFISAMPMGYDTPLSEGGKALSGGERQRIVLARALVRQPVILLLDEATSALDARTEAAVQRAIAGLDCTRVVIAHRLSTVRDADLILVVDDGALVEQGSHDELLTRRGIYHQLVHGQLRQSAAIAGDDDPGQNETESER
ncbi:MAG: peptidase domain-containing ABC transporter, partial [Myxococcota bacterium]